LCSRTLLERKRKTMGCRNIEEITQQLAKKSFRKSNFIRREMRPWLTAGEDNFLTWKDISCTIPEENESFQDTFLFLYKLKIKDENQELSYCCIVDSCHKRFQAVNQLTQHMKTIHGSHFAPYPFQCHVCNQRCPSSIRLNAHMDRRHDDVKFPYVCSVPLCDSKYTTQRRLTHHMATHHPQVPYEDDREGNIYSYRDKAVMGLKIYNKSRQNIKTRRVIRCQEVDCNYRTQFPNYMEGHRLQNHTTEPGQLPYSCTECERRFKNSRACRSHYRNHHGTKKSICAFCGKVFPGVGRLDEHTRSKHRDAATEYKCKICTRTYFFPEVMDRHEERHRHVSNFDCAIPSCDPSVRNHNTLESLIEHVQSYHEQKKELICHICGFTTNAKFPVQSMKGHMLKHGKEKTVKCKYCDKLFRYDAELIFHHDLHHHDITKSKYKCPDCDQIFHVFQYVYRHFKKKHPSKPIPTFKREKFTDEQN